MKTTALTLAGSLLLVSATVPAGAQPQPGAYLSGQQLAANRPAIAGIVGPLDKPAGYLEVVDPTTYAVHRLPLARVWGYTTAAGQAYRLVNRQAFTIEQRDSLVVYSRQRTIQHSRSAHTVTEFFYSVGLTGDLRPLTRRGLRQHIAAPLLTSPTEPAAATTPATIPLPEATR